MVILFTALVPEFTGKLNDVTAPEHTEVTLTCELNDEEFEVKWFNKNVELKPSDRYEFVHEGCVHKLIIKDALKSDTGNITCKTKNIKTTAKLTVVPGGKAPSLVQWGRIICVVLHIKLCSLHSFFFSNVQVISDTLACQCYQNVFFHFVLEYVFLIKLIILKES